MELRKTDAGKNVVRDYGHLKSQLCYRIIYLFSLEEGGKLRNLLLKMINIHRSLCSPPHANVISSLVLSGCIEVRATIFNVNFFHEDDT